jgi:hypothetical protein
MCGDVKFFRHTALLLPSAFLLNVLLFLLTHGRSDPGFGAYPFFQDWLGEAAASVAPETRFLEQAAVFFAPAYVVALLFILSISVAERALFGPKKRRKASGYGRAFGTAFPVLFLFGSVLLMWAGAGYAARHAPGSLVAPLLAALAPFGAAALALLPAAAAAGPLAVVRRVGDA